MAQIRTSLLALGISLVAVPALAGGVAIDLPRLTFPTPQTETSRDCMAIALPGAPATCEATLN